MPLLIDGYNSEDLVSPPSELVAYWKLGEASGNAIDSKAGYDAVENGTVPSSSESPVGFSTSRGAFDGNNNFEWDASGSSATVFDASTFLVECWVNFDSLALGAMVAKQDGGGTNGWNLGLTAADKFIFFMYNWTLVSAASATTGGWHYVVGANRATSGANESRLYVNNAIADQDTGFNFSAKTTRNLTIGAMDDGGLPFPRAIDGYIKDAAYWDLTGTSKSWSDIEAVINERYNDGAGRGYSL